MTSGRWADSTRASRLPRDWARLVQHVKARDQGRCRRCGILCAFQTRGRWHGGEVDHITRGDDHTLANLQLLCVPCHRTKTQAEANRRPTRLRPAEPHPSLRTP